MKMKDNVVVWPRVISDMVIRNEQGKAKYNKYLTTNMGENMLQHAYEETLDLAVYLKTKLLEQEEKDLDMSLERKAVEVYGCNAI